MKKILKSNKPKFIIRHATKKDVSQMLKIIGVNNPKYPVSVARKEIMEMFSGALHKPIYLVMEDKKEVIGLGGFVRSWIDNKVVNIFWINVKSEYQGNGIGSKLIEGLIEEIGKLGKPVAKMVTLSTNKPKFYGKFGFKKISPKYDGNYILMGKVLG